MLLSEAKKNETWDSSFEASGGIRGGNNCMVAEQRMHQHAF